MNGKSKLVEERFSQVNCAQTVFSLHAEDLGLDELTAIKIASCFGGGMKRGATCGAVTGAYMTIGLKYGDQGNDPEEKAKMEERIKYFNQLFIDKYGSLDCKDLIGFNISIQEEKDAGKEAGVFTNICPKLIKTACDILEKEF